MKPLVYGALLGVLWLFLRLPIAPTAGLLAMVIQPVTLAFVLGLLARPHLSRWRWSR